MKYLRQYIRQILLTEGMKTASDLPGNIAIEISPEEGRNGEECTISYVRLIKNNIFAHNPPSRDPEGFISIYEARRVLGDGPCGAAWTVYAAEADQGWGPMLYDVAIEYATSVAGGLISDRESVSEEARRVWDYYMKNRGDVTGIQLDDLKNTLTPEEEDNCSQTVAISDEQGNRIDTHWTKSSLSKRWTKPPTTITALRKLGKLVEL